MDVCSHESEENGPNSLRCNDMKAMQTMSNLYSTVKSYGYSKRCKIYIALVLSNYIK